MTTIKNLLYKYKNGGYKVEIYTDGTKIRTQLTDSPPITPESIDLKVTNRCDLESICKWCHEQSYDYGDHGNLKRIADILQDLPAGSELAIGGGNALVHPDLTDFLQRMKNRGIICNITINQRHINAYRKLLTHLITNNLIYGLGISKSGDKSIAWVYELTDNVVFHVIAGINTPDEILMLPKVLILGYKQVGRGETYYDINVEMNIKKWKQEIVKRLGNSTISFDNLALEQLQIKKLITPEKWDEIYMGEDSTFTYYIDAVKQRFGLSSTKGAHFSLMDTSAEMLKYVRNVQQHQMS